MTRTVCILLSLILSAAICAEERGSAPDECSDDPTARFSQAQTLYRSGQFMRALGFAEQLSHCYPENVDYQFLRALTLNAVGRSDEALAAARFAQQLAPDYKDVSDLVARLDKPATEAPDATDEPEPANPPTRVETNATALAPDTDALVASDTQALAATPENRWSIIAIAGAHQLTGGRDGWSELSLGTLAETPDGRVFELAVDRESRGDASDASLRGGVVWPLTQQTRIATGLMFTPSATFRAEQLVTLQLEHDLPAGWVARAGGAHRSFADDRSQSVLVSVDRYYSAFRFSFGMNLARLDSAGSATSYVGSVDWYRDAQNRFRVTVGAGTELDTIADGTRVLESRVLSLTLTGSHELRPRLAVGWWLGTLEQGDFYDRHYAGFSVTRRY